MRITEENYPNVHAAISNVAYDNGMVNAGQTLEELADVPSRWEPYLQMVETALGTLSKTEPAPEDVDTLNYLEKNPTAVVNADQHSEFNCFAAGEDTAVRAIVDRTPNGAVAYNLLNDFFEGWSLFDEPPFAPEILRS